eukprot:c9168_g1_i1.p1 GENE.c9168_g1_i1~~c9168_g1_i1.p1  ORF type:complete len:434 (+),score=105.76 c9168_g1_i1:348-1649(+)
MDFGPKFSNSVKALCRNPIREISVKCRDIGGITLAGGRPPQSTFPISGLTVRSDDGEEIAAMNLGDDELNYGPVCSVGYPPLAKWAEDFLKRHHNPPNEHWTTIISPGNTDGINKIMWLLTNPGDVILTEEYAYTGLMMIARPNGREVKGCRMDSEGIIPEALEEAFHELSRAGKAPNLLYVVPVGHNPTGVVYSTARKQQLYEVCSRLNLVILEDDPYYYVQLASRDPNQCPGLKVNTPSFLSFDRDGRVVRLDSFSKTVAPALRLGYIALHRQLAAKLTILNEISTWSLSGPGQVMLLGMLITWGEEGLDKQMRRVQATYTEGRDNLLEAIQKHLGSRVTYAPPTAGMFVWLKANGIEDAAPLVDVLFQHKVAMVPGSAFSPEGKPSAYMRCSFTQCTPTVADTAIERVARAIENHLETVKTADPANAKEN